METKLRFLLQRLFLLQNISGVLPSGCVIVLVVCFAKKSFIFKIVLAKKKKKKRIIKGKIVIIKIQL